MKSHLPADALPIAPEARYVFFGRNGKDLGMSFHDYLYNFSGPTMSTINLIHAEWSGDSTPLGDSQEYAGLLRPEARHNGLGCCDLLDIMKSWWGLERAERAPASLLVAEDDLPGQIARLAEFFSIDPMSLRKNPIVEIVLSIT